MSSHSLMISSGAERILSHNIGFTPAEVNTAAKTIRDYSMPQQSTDIVDWNRYVTNNVYHVVRIVLNKLSLGLVSLSDWSKLENKVYESMVTRAKADIQNFPALHRVLNFPVNESLPNGVSRESFKEAQVMFKQIDAIVTTGRARLYAQRMLTACLQAHANQLNDVEINTLPDGNLSVSQFMVKVRADRQLVCDALSTRTTRTIYSFSPDNDVLEIREG